VLVLLSAKRQDGLWGPLNLLFKGVKEQGCEVDYSHPYSTEV